MKQVDGTRRVVHSYAHKPAFDLTQAEKILQNGRCPRRVQPAVDVGGRPGQRGRRAEILQRAGPEIFPRGIAYGEAQIFGQIQPEVRKIAEHDPGHSKIGEGGGRCNADGAAPEQHRRLTGKIPALTGGDHTAPGRPAAHSEGLDQACQPVRDAVVHRIQPHIAPSLRYEDVFGKSSQCPCAGGIVLCIQRVGIYPFSNGEIRDQTAGFDHPGNRFVAEFAAHGYLVPGAWPAEKDGGIGTADAGINVLNQYVMFAHLGKGELFQSDLFFSCIDCCFHSGSPFWPGRATHCCMMALIFWMESTQSFCSHWSTMAIRPWM